MTEQMSKLTRPLRPVELLKKGEINLLFPDIHKRAELGGFLNRFLPLYSSEEQKIARRSQRAEFSALAAPALSEDKLPVKIGLFDVDETLAHLYMMSSTAGDWALDRLSTQHGIGMKELCGAVKSMRGEYICHAPHEMMIGVSNILGRPELHPDNNAEIMRDWRDARTALNLQWQFKETIPLFQEMKDNGSLVYLATSSMPASLFHRLYLWFGEENIHLIDGISVSKTLPGDGGKIPPLEAVNAFACEGERRFVQRLHDEGKVILVDHEHLKPHPQHLVAALEHANKNRLPDTQEIMPNECFLVDDSLKAGVAASAAGMHFAHTIKALVVDPRAIDAQKRCGCPNGKLGLEPLVNLHQSGLHARPDIVIHNLYDLKRLFEFTAADLPSKPKLVIDNKLGQRNDLATAAMRYGVR